MSHIRRLVKSGALSPQDLTGTAAADERRKEPRIASNRTVAILPCGSSGHDDWRFSQAQLLDCSMSGIGLVTDIPLQAGDEFLVKLQLKKTVLIQYSVCHCTTLGLRKYKIGAELRGVIGSEAETHSLVELLAGAPAPPDGA